MELYQPGVNMSIVPGQPGPHSEILSQKAKSSKQINCLIN